MKQLQHVAFIPDGNRRWAKQKGLPTLAGHKAGYETFGPLIEYAVLQKIPYLTFWAFSTENWQRSKREVDYLLNLFRQLLDGRRTRKLAKKGVKFFVLGDRSRFPEDIQQKMSKLVDDTKDNQQIWVNIALNYGGRDEILRAVNRLLLQKATQVNSQSFADCLYTVGQPDPDLIIRTSGEQRLSGLLPWQGVYSELYFTNIYWPDFNEAEFQKAIDDYYQRDRRFGR